MQAPFALLIPYDEALQRLFIFNKLPKHLDTVARQLDEVVEVNLSECANMKTLIDQSLTNKSRILGKAKESGGYPVQSLK